MATEVVPHQSNFWIYYDSFTQLISRIRSRTFSESELYYAKPDQSIFINDLPEEILLLIFQYLSQSHLAKCERVCQNWLHVIRSGGSKLWNRADICYHGVQTKCISYDFAGKYPKRSRHLSDSQTGERLDPHKKLELYVQYLLQMKPRLMSLTISLDFIDERASKAIEFLITSGFCSELRDVELRWIDEDRANDSMLFDEHTYDLSCLHYNENLKHLMLHAPKITRLQTQLNFGFESLKYLPKFSNLLELDIVCVPRVALLMPWHIEKILDKLTQLRVFRLQVTVNHSQYSNSLSKFTIESKSLQTLDVSDCVNFVISTMDLPNLEVFRAVDTKIYSAFQHNNDIPCLFDVITTGCPRLKEINGVPISPKERDNGISEIKQKQLNICFCARKHAEA